MLVLYKSWKKYNEFQLTKKQNGLDPVTYPLGKTDETGGSAALPNLNTIIINKIVR